MPRIQSTTRPPTPLSDEEVAYVIGSSPAWRAPHSRRPIGVLKAGFERLVHQAAHALRRADPDRHLEDVARQLGGAGDARPAAGQHHPRRQHAGVAGALHFFADKGEISLMRASMISHSLRRWIVCPPPSPSTATFSSSSG